MFFLLILRKIFQSRKQLIRENKQKKLKAKNFITRVLDHKDQFPLISFEIPAEGQISPPYPATLFTKNNLFERVTRDQNEGQQLRKAFAQNMGF